MARILVLCSRIPYPLTDGAKIRIYNTARLLNQDHTVDLLMIDRTGHHKKEIDTLATQFNKVIFFPYPQYTFYLNTVPGLLSRRPLQTFYFSFSDVQTWIDAHKDRYDLFYSNHIRMAPYVEHLEKPKVVDLVDAMSRGYAKAANCASGIWRFLYPIESKRLLRYEKQVIETFDHSFIVSATDKQFLLPNSPPSSSLSVMPNGVKEYLLQHSNPRHNPETNWLVFLGSMRYDPNADAASYFAEEIFPEIRQQHPLMKFLIVGKCPTKKVRKLGKKPGIFVTGFVDDPAQYLAKARVVVAPMRFGTGFHNKVLEAMALGKPVVTTHLGTEGIATVDGTHIKIANEKKEFINAINELLEHPEERKRLGQNARQLVEEHYTWESIKPKLLTPIENILT